jgi:exonuclease III
MLLVSWNVASWPQTLKLIVRWHGSLLNWLNYHGIDILALQEVKVVREKVENDASAVAAAIPGFDTFWCCCKEKKAKGFNGTTTIARHGLTIGADCTPLGNTVFDDEGRCVATDHGRFVLFNVYVPNSGMVQAGGISLHPLIPS